VEGGFIVSHFINLKEALRSMETDPSTVHEPIKRMFVCDGEFMSANVALVERSESALHTQKEHDELVVILEGDADFRVGEETRHVQAGDLVFIPRNTVHGPILGKGKKLAALSVYAPFFDRSRRNIDWGCDRFA
jgi:quercetin dioxygenase-like cupin family protein